MKASFALGLLLASAACGGGGADKAAGSTCVSSSECAAGLLCDLAQSPPVCAGSGITPPDVDAATVDGHPLIDAPGHADAAVHDAATDAPVDAPVDAPDAM